MFQEGPAPSLAPSSASRGGLAQEWPARSGGDSHLGLHAHVFQWAHHSLLWSVPWGAGAGVDGPWVPSLAGHTDVH